MTENNLTKIVYFDEQSALEYLDMKNRGRYIFNTESEKQSGTDVDIKGDGKLSLGSKIWDKIGGGISGSVSAGADFYRNNQTLINSSISNTILTDFLIYIEGENLIKEFEGYSLEIIKDSFAYLKAFAPMLDLLSDKFLNENHEFKDFDVKELSNFLETTRGYYEFLANSGEEKYILRLNIKALRNNYKLGDIQSMELKYYGVKVGSLEVEDVKIMNYLENINKETTDNDTEQIESVLDTLKKHTDEDIAKNFENNEDTNKDPEPSINNKFDVYDIILGGI